MIIDLFIPCYIDNFFPGTAFNMIQVLEKIGCSVHYNADQTCCGRPAFLDGYIDHCKEVGTKFIHEFENDRYIVAPSPTCVAMIKNYYSGLFHNTVLHNEYKQIQKNIFEFTDFLVTVMNVTDLGASMNATATYHDSCSALRELRISEQPRRLLNHVKNLKLIEMQQPEICCGSGGGFASRFEKFADDIAINKCNDIQSTSAEYAVSNDYTCLMHLKKHLDSRGIKIMHIADVLVQGW